MWAQLGSNQRPPDYESGVQIRNTISEKLGNWRDYSVIPRGGTQQSISKSRTRFARKVLLFVASSLEQAQLGMLQIKNPPTGVDGL